MIAHPNKPDKNTLTQQAYADCVNQKANAQNLMLSGQITQQEYNALLEKIEKELESDLQAIPTLLENQL